MRRALVLVTTAAAMTVPVASANAATILVKDDFFSPKSKTYKLNTLVTFKWAGEAPHDVVAKRSGKKVWSIGIRTKGSVKRRFTKTGTYTLICTVHAPDMKAIIKVVR